MSTAANDDVYNLVMVVATSALSIGELSAALRQMHRQATAPNPC